MPALSTHSIAQNMELLSAPPAMWKTYRQILLGKRQSGFRPQQPLPDLAVRLDGVKIKRKHLRRYDSVCAHEGVDGLLATYPQILCFPVLMSMLASDRFPLPVLGLVHTKNTIRYLKPIHSDDVLTISVKIATQRLLEKGLEFDVDIDMSVAGETVWNATMSMLSRCTTDVPRAEKAARDTPIESNISYWQLPAGLGRQYGLASGDLNPIHLSALTAKLFGFRRAIAHGMWSKAKCLADLTGLLPPCPYEVSVKFKTPIFLPGTIRFAHQQAGEESAFDLWSSDASKPHLIGTVRPLAKQ